MTTDNNDCSKRIIGSKIVPSEFIESMIKSLVLDKQIVTEELLLSQLVSNGRLSRWQARMIASGKFRGFVFDDIVFLKIYGNAKDTWRIAEAWDRRRNIYLLVRANFGLNGLTVEHLLNLTAEQPADFPSVSTDARLLKIE